MWSHSRASNRHSPDDLQIRGNRTTAPPPRELYPLCSHPGRGADRVHERDRAGGDEARGQGRLPGRLAHASSGRDDARLIEAAPGECPRRPLLAERGQGREAPRVPGTAPAGGAAEASIT